MKYLVQLALIFGFCLIGDALALLLPFPFPGSVLSMILVLLLLLSGVLKESAIKESADFMLKNMTFFFVPPVVGIMQYTQLVQSIWVQLLVVNLVSLVACFVASSYTVVLVMKVETLVRRKCHA